MLTIKAVNYDSDGKVTEMQLSSDVVVTAEQAIAMCRKGMLPAYMISHRGDTEFLKLRNNVINVTPISELTAI